MDAIREHFTFLASNGKVEIFHKSCDGLIVYNSGNFICSNCNVSWRQHWIENIASSDDIGYRFKVKDIDPEDGALYKIVEVTDGSITYQTLKKVESPQDEFAKSMADFFNSFPW